MKEANNFKYLGSFAADTKRDSCQERVEPRVFATKKNIFQTENSESTKVFLFIECVETILLFSRDRSGKTPKWHFHMSSNASSELN